MRVLYAYVYVISVEEPSATGHAQQSDFDIYPPLMTLKPHESECIIWIDLKQAIQA